MSRNKRNVYTSISHWTHFPFGFLSFSSFSVFFFSFSFRFGGNLDNRICFSHTQTKFNGSCACCTLHSKLNSPCVSGGLWTECMQPHHRVSVCCRIYRLYIGCMWMWTVECLLCVERALNPHLLLAILIAVELERFSILLDSRYDLCFMHIVDLFYMCRVPTHLSHHVTATAQLMYFVHILTPLS